MDGTEAFLKGETLRLSRRQYTLADRYYRKAIAIKGNRCAEHVMLGKQRAANSSTTLS